MVYLDNSATTKPASEVIQRMAWWRDASFANASSVHQPGQRARVVVEVARETIARFIGAEPKEVVFTSGGTESNNWALKGYAFHHRRLSGNWPALLIPPTEHHAILEPAAYLESLGAPLIHLPVDRDGRVCPDDLRSALESAPSGIPPLVSIMHANNETGVINPIAELATVAHARGAIFHADAVQSVGKIETGVASLGVDMMTISAHKLHGPKGIGALYLSKKIEIDPLIHGGSQERNRRGGTEAVELIVGFEQSLALLTEERQNDYGAKMKKLSDHLRRLLQKIDDIQMVTPARDVLPNIVSITFNDAAELDGEGVIVGMDLEGVAVSNGAACTSGSIQPSHVLSAIGLPDVQAKVAVRFSLSRYTTEEEIDAAVDALKKVLARMR